MQVERLTRRHRSAGLMGALVSVVLLFGKVRQLEGQIGFESLIGGIHDVAFSFSCWNTQSGFLKPTATCPSDRAGYGIEVLWSLGSIVLRKYPNPDTIYVITGRQIRRVPSGGVDTTDILVPRLKLNRDRELLISFELGLGYGQFTGFESADPHYDLYGAVRELPAVSVYAALDGYGVLKHVKPYVGLRSGLIHAHGFQLITSPMPDSSHTFVGAAQTFQLGGSIGVAVGINRFLIFSEWAYNSRRFSSVHWASPGLTRSPASFPRTMDFSGSSISLGVQITVREPG